jgi:hypothetical protein
MVKLKEEMGFEGEFLRQRWFSYESVIKWMVIASVFFTLIFGMSIAILFEKVGWTEEQLIEMHKYRTQIYNREVTGG